MLFGAVLHSGMAQKGTKPGGVMILLGISVRLTGLDVFLSVALLARPCKESPRVGASLVLIPLLIHRHLLPQNANSNM